MLRNRILIMVGACLLAATAAWADDVGYVDCNSHSEGAQLFGKPRKTPDTIGTLPCGERFTVLVYGFFFSRVETKDGQIAYVYSSLISVDRAAAALPQPAQPSAQPARQPAAQPAATLTMAGEKTKIAKPAPFDPPPATAAPSTAPAPLQTAAAQQQVVSEPAATPASSASNTSATAQTIVTDTPAVATPQPAATQPAAAQPVVEAAPASPAAEAQPSAPVAETQPEPAPAQPPAKPAPPIKPAVRPEDARASWEQPLPGARKAPLLELYGGYAFARLGGTGSSGTNMNGGLGSFGWNAKEWLQVVGDTSYSTNTVNGTKNALYGNHFGVRVYYRARMKWGLLPFAEGLVGGSSLKTTVSGAGGYTASTGSAISYKIGGGLDIHPSKRWEVRLFDFDYYKTTFTGVPQQNNYWISTGVVLRLFGGGYE